MPAAPLPRLTGEPVGWETARPRRHHVVGAAIFGVGWAVADTCPAPIAAQLGQGALWSRFTFAGVLVGILAHLRRQEEPAPARRREPGRSAQPATARTD